MKRPVGGGRLLLVLIGSIALACVGQDPDPVTSAAPAALDALPPDWAEGSIVDLDADDHTGWTRGVFAVGADGGATYDVPMWTPPGRAGVEPHLSLHYSSRAGESSVGVGWTLTGLSAVTRCARTRSVDGDELSAVRWDQQNYCLEGVRLVPTDTTHFRPLRNGTERIGFEGDVRNPTVFVVEHDDGMRYRYEQRVEAGGCGPGHLTTDPIGPIGTTVTYAWLLTRIEDLAGNFMTVDYSQVTHDAVSGAADTPLTALAAAGCAPVEWVPHRMAYTGSQTSAPRRSVTFTYREVADARSVRLISGALACDRQSDPACRSDGTRPVGIATVTSRFLSDIEMHGPDPAAAAARHYAVGGDLSVSTHQWRVLRIAECVGTICRAPLEFEYTDSGDTFGGDTPIGLGDAARIASDSTVISSLAPFSTVSHADFDGDGADEVHVYGSSVSEILRYRAPDGVVRDILSHPLRAQMIPYDADGDGRADMATDDGLGGAIVTRPIVLIAGSDDPDLPRTYSVGSGVVAGTESLACPSGDTLPWGRTCLEFVHPAIGFVRTLAQWDAEGSGVPRLVAQCAYSQQVDRFTFGPGGSCGEGSPAYLENRLLTQWIGAGAGSTFAERVATLPFGQGPSPVPFAELNLDGSGRIAVAHRRDARTVAVPSWQDLNLDDDATWIFLDVNGDGLSDALDISTAQWRVRLNMGSFFGPPTRAFDESHPEYVSVTRADLRVADFNGDGRADLGVLVPGQSGGSASGSPTATLAHLDIHLWSGERFTPLREMVRGAPPSLPAGLRDPVTDSWPLTSLLDFDGDGMVDLQYAAIPSDDPDHVQLEMRRIFRAQPGLLLRVVRSGAPQVSAQYSRRHYRVGDCNALVQPVGCAGSVTTVERHWDELNGEYRHTYAGPRFDVEGGGWLGFLRHTVHEPPAAAGEVRYTDTFFQPPTDADFDLPGDAGRYVTVGQPRVSLHVAGTEGGTLTVSARFVEYARSTATSLPGSAYPLVTVTAVHLRTWSDVPASSWAPPAEGDLASVPELGIDGFPVPFFSFLTRSVDRRFTYAPYGFAVPNGVVETNGVGGTATVALTTHADTTHWLLALTDEARVTSTTEDHLSYTRTSAFEWGGYDGLGLGANGLPHLLHRTTREPDGPTDLWQQVELDRDVFGNVTTTTVRNLTGDPPQQSSLFTDEEGIFPRNVTDALGHQQWIGIDPTLGVAVYAVDARGSVSRSTYDRFGRLRSTTGHGTRATVAYGRRGTACAGAGAMLVARRSASGGEDQSCIDQFGRSQWHSVVGFDGEMVSAVQYDSLGRVSRASPPQYGGGPPSRYETFTYDALDRITRIDFTGDGGQPITARYKGNIAQYTDRRGHTSTTLTDLAGRTSLSIDSPADTRSSITYTKYAYGPFGNLREVTDHQGHSWSWERDSHGRRVASHDPDAGHRFYTYDGFDRVTAELASRGGPVRTRYHYDELSRLTLIESLGDDVSGGDGTTVMEWDTAPIDVSGPSDGTPSALAVGLPSRTIRARDGVMREYRYDEFGRVTRDTTTIGAADDLEHPTTVTGDAFQVAYGYEVGTGRLSSVTYPQVAPGVAPRTVTYGYHPDSGQPVSASVDGSPIWTADDYDGQGRLLAETFGNETHTEYTYGEHDPRGHVPWLEEIRTTDSSGHALMDLSYTYDPNGNVLTRSESVMGRSEAFTYDGLSRMRTRTLSAGRRHEPTERYDYDDVGNLTNNAGVPQTYSDTQPHVLTQAGPRRVETDSRGRITRGPGFHVSSYTDFDLPRTMSGRGGTATLSYDAGGERVRKTEAGDVTTYVHGLYERHQHGRQTTHTWNVAVGGRTVAQISQTGPRGRPATNYLHADRNGSTVLVTNTSRPGAGPGGEHYVYSPFGTRSRLDTVGIPPPSERPGFTGDQEDPELSAVNMHGRIYSPSIGRFITPDPIIGGRSRQAWNAYSYALNNPETLIDPTGYQVDSPGDAASTAVALLASFITFVTTQNWGGGDGNSAQLGATTSYSQASAPIPAASTAEHLDSIGGTPSPQEGTGQQRIDSIASAEGAHAVGERIYDNIERAVASTLGLDGPQSDGERVAAALLVPLPAYRAVVGAAGLAYAVGTPWGLADTGSAVAGYTHRVAGAWDTHLAGDDRPLCNLVADTTSTVAVVAGTVITGRIVGGAVAADAAAADTSAATALSEATPAAQAGVDAAAATGTDASGGAVVASEAAARLGVGDTYSAYLSGYSDGLMAQLGEDGMLDLYIKAGPSTPRGGAMFNEALDAFGGTGNIRGIRGTWIGGGDLSANFDAFRAAVGSGATPEVAAVRTFTGEMARRAGYTVARVVEDLGSTVMVEFTR